MLENQKLDLILVMLEKLDDKFGRLDHKVVHLEERFDRLEERFDKLEDRFDRLEQRVIQLEEKVEALQKDVAEIKLVLENEIRKNISRAAEGHLDLSRNLQELVKPNSEMEMLSIRILETDMKDLKQKIS